MKKFLLNVLKAIARVSAVIAVLLLAAWIVFAQPSCRQSARSPATVEPESLRGHVRALSAHFHPRDWNHPENLESCAGYIAQNLVDAGAAVRSQPVNVGDQAYRNVIGSFAPGGSPRFIIGAHYDAYDGSPGADDNASGVAVLLEVVALLVGMESPPPVDLVAYTLEEPPYFGTAQMGSAVHAKSLKGEFERIRGGIVLEMVGYFSDERGSQSYPAPFLRLLYPNRGNFVGVVSRWDQGEWIKSVKIAMKGATDLPVYSIRAPEALPGVDFSDHRNYWPYGIPSLMVTDTAFYRNETYHSVEDTSDRLNYRRMAQFTVAVFAAVKSLARTESGSSPHGGE